MESLVELFVHVDDFWQAFQPYWYEKLLTRGERQRQREGQMSESEVMTIVILFHQAQYRNVKAFYLDYVCRDLKAEFPRLVSYQRFVDSTPLRVCHNRRIQRHRIFEGWAARGKTSMGWFYNFKLHLVVNHQGELIAFDLTLGNVDDREPLPSLTQHLYGKLFGDKRYLSKTL